MSNMSYCRFQNTDKDLSVCKDALEELFNHECGPLSREETVAAESLISNCISIVELFLEQAGCESFEEFLDSSEARRISNVLDKANKEVQPEDEED